MRRIFREQSFFIDGIFAVASYLSVDKNNDLGGREIFRLFLYRKPILTISED